MEFLRNWRTSGEERQEEALNAYLDDALSAGERQHLERQLAKDEQLRAQLEELRSLKQQLRQLPRLPVPRNFMLDPAVYGRPEKKLLFQPVPVLRLATALTAFFFVVAVAAELISPQFGALSSPGDRDVAMVEAPAAGPASTAVEVTRVVTEREEVQQEVAELQVETAVEIQEEEIVTSEEQAAAEEPQAEGTVDETADQQTGQAPAEAEAAGEVVEGEGSAATSSAFAESANLATASPAVAPTSVLTPTPAPTSAPMMLASPALQATPTVSTPPRPVAGTEEQNRAIAAVPPEVEATAADQIGARAAVPTATTQDEQRPISQPISGLRLVQIILGVLVVVFAVSALVARRRQV